MHLCHSVESFVCLLYKQHQYVKRRIIGRMRQVYISLQFESQPMRIAHF